MPAGRAGACAWVSVLLLAAALPSPASRYFDGLPWTSVPELLLFLVAAGVLGSAAAARRLGGRFASLPRAPAWSLLALPLIVLGLKLAVGSIASPAGFAACYGSLVPDRPAPPCERSFDAPFAPATLTRYDRTIDFSDAWRLGFVNSRRFNFYRPGEFDRQRLPFRAAWLGVIDVGDDEAIEIGYVGEGAVAVGTAAAVLSGSYERPSSVRLALPPGPHRLALSYRYDDGSRVGAPSGAAGPVMRAEAVAADGARRLLEPRRGAAARLAVAALEGALGLGFVALVVALTPAVRTFIGLAACVVWLVLARETGLTPQWSFAVLAGAAAAASFASWGRRPSLLLAVSLAVAAAHARWRLGSWSAMLIRSGGNDWLTYESFARAILEDRSLEGGEAVFYYQPFYRYAKFVLRLLFGDADFLTHTALSAGLYAGVLVMVACLAARLPARARVLPFLTGLAMLAVLTSHWMHTIAVRGLSEPLAWMLFPWTIAALFCSSAFSMQTLGMGLAGLGVITRFNHLPALLLLAGSFLLRQGARVTTRTVVPAAVLAGVLLLPLVHNLWYGGAFVLTTRSAAIPQNLVLSPSQVLEAPGDPEMRGRLVRHLGQMVNVQAGWWSWDLLLGGFRLSEALWVVALGVALWRWTWYHASVALLPAAYLVVHVFYQINVYYPRHIVSAHLAMAVSACLVLLPRPSRRGVHGST